MRSEKFSLAAQKIPFFSEANQLVSEILKLIDPLTSCLTLDESLKLNTKIHQSLKKIESNSRLALNSNEKLNHIKGCLLWTRLSQTIGRVYYDSYPSKVLTLFPQVQTLTPVQQKSFKIALAELYGLELNRVFSINKEVDYVTSNLRIKNQIVEFILKQLSLGLSHAKLFKQITGYSVLGHQQIDVTITNATIFFTFEFDQAGLSGQTLQHCSLDDKINVEKLFNQLDSFSNTERANFPAVGKWQSLLMDPIFLTELCDYLADKCNLVVSKNILQNTIATMVYLAPHQDAESFFVHDAYGHSWQESLCEFEHLYSYLSRLTQPCTLVSLEKIINKNLDVDSLLPHLQTLFITYYNHQLDIVSNALLAEFTADAMEYHLQQTLSEKGENIPTSSKMRHFSLFLDLSLKDTIKHIGSLKVGIEAEFSDDRKQTIIQLLNIQYGENIKNNNLINKLEEWFKSSIAKDFYPANTDQISLIETNLFVQLLKIYVPLDDYIEQNKSQQNPASQLQQLLLVLTTLYQSDPSKIFWQLDRYIKNYNFCPV